MTKDRMRGYCPRCRHDQIFAKHKINHGMHLFLTVITLGLWLVSWVAITLGNLLRPWRCQQCGWYNSRPAARRARGEKERRLEAAYDEAAGRQALPPG